APYNDDPDVRQSVKEFKRKLKEALAAGHLGEAVGLFMMFAGMPADQLEGMRQYPMWPMWEALAPTIAYELAIMGEDGSIPTERAARVSVPTLVMDGSESEVPTHTANATLARVIP